MTLLNTLFPNTRASTAACDEQCAAATVRPHYTVTAEAEAWTLKAHLPGVAKAGLSITDENGVLAIRGERAWQRPEGWTALHRESDDAAYELALRHDGAIDVEKIRAEFADGVLTATFPKAEAIKPRKIAVS